MARSTGKGRNTRPTRDIYDVVAVTKDGKTVRVIDRAVEVTRLGGNHTDVAARCGIAREVVYEWERTGTKTAADVHAGRRTLADCSKHERKCFDFVQAMVEAEVEKKLYLLGISEQVAVGGRDVLTVKEKYDAAGNIIERVEQTETQAPNPQMLRYLLAVHWPDQFSERRVHELTGPAGGPIAVEVTPVVDQLLADLERIATNHAETDPLIAAAHHATNGTANGHT